MCLKFQSAIILKKIFEFSFLYYSFYVEIRGLLLYAKVIIVTDLTMQTWKDLIWTGENFAPI